MFGIWIESDQAREAVIHEPTPYVDRRWTALTGPAMAHGASRGVIGRRKLHKREHLDGN